MNLRLLLEVIARFKYLVLAGVLLATVLATLAMVRVTFDGSVPRVQYRSQETWESVSTLLVTKDGFTYGLATLGDERSREVEEGRFQRLAALYARMAKSDEVRKLVRRDGPIEGKFSAERSADLPVIRIAAESTTAAKAKDLSGRVMSGLVAHLRALQVSNKIPADQRVQLEVLEQPRKAELLEGRKKTGSIFVFILVLSATLMLAFALDNLRPRVVVAEPVAATGPTPVPEAERRTA